MTRSARFGVLSPCRRPWVTSILPISMTAYPSSIWQSPSIPARSSQVTLGSERRSKYGFVGHAMNVTSRIEDAAGPGEVLISGSTRDKLPDALVVGDRRELSAKGMEEALVVYPLLEVLL